MPPVVPLRTVLARLTRAATCADCGSPVSRGAVRGRPILGDGDVRFLHELGWTPETLQGRLDTLARDRVRTFRVRSLDDANRFYRVWARDGRSIVTGPVAGAPPGVHHVDIERVDPLCATCYPAAKADADRRSRDRKREEWDVRRDNLRRRDEQEERRRVSAD